MPDNDFYEDDEDPAEVFAAVERGISAGLRTGPRPKVTVTDNPVLDASGRSLTIRDCVVVGASWVSVR